jgi:hypothetical protein
VLGGVGKYELVQLPELSKYLGLRKKNVLESYGLLGSSFLLPDKLGAFRFSGVRSNKV